jgi:ADP-L-glycero-D-manno-heptose 6-epimerase
MGRQPEIEYIEMPEAIRDQYQYFTEAQMDKLRSAGNTMPFQSLEDAIFDYVVNYLKKGDRCL